MTKLTTNNAPVILLYETKFFIMGTNSSTWLNLRCREMQDLIIIGSVNKVIREMIGKMCAITETMIIP